MKFKPVVSIVLIIVLSACEASQPIVKEDSRTNFSISGCPEDGTCTFEVLKDSSLQLKTDGIGKLYPEIQKGAKNVLKFEFERHRDPRIADSGYREIIFLEIDPTQKSIELKDQELTSAKALFGRLCFCGEQAGYFPIKSGSFTKQTLENNHKTYSLKLDMKGLPHKIKSLTVKR